MSIAHNIKNAASNTKDSIEMAEDESDDSFVNDEGATQYEFCDGSVLIISDHGVYAYGSKS